MAGSVIFVSTILSRTCHMDLDLDFGLDLDVLVFERYSQPLACESLLIV